MVDMSGDVNEPPYQQRCPGNDNVCPPPDDSLPSTSSRTTRSCNVKRNVTLSCAKKPMPKKPVVPVKKLSSKSKKKKDTPQKPPKISVIEAEDSDCLVCKKEVESDAKALQCDRCNLWNHAKCIAMSEEEYVLISTSGDEWYCVGCRVMPPLLPRWNKPQDSDEVIVNLDIGEVVNSVESKNFQRMPCL